MVNRWPSRALLEVLLFKSLRLLSEGEQAQPNCYFVYVPAPPKGGGAQALAHRAHLLLAEGQQLSEDIPSPFGAITLRSSNKRITQSGGRAALRSTILCYADSTL